MPLLQSGTELFATERPRLGRYNVSNNRSCLLTDVDKTTVDFVFEQQKQIKAAERAIDHLGAALGLIAEIITPGIDSRNVATADVIEAVRRLKAREDQSPK